MKVRDFTKIENLFIGVTGLFVVLRSITIGVIFLGLVSLAILFFYYMSASLQTSSFEGGIIFVILFFAVAFLLFVIFLYERVIIAALNLRKWALYILFFYFFFNLIPLTYLTTSNIVHILGEAIFPTIVIVLVYFTYVSMALFMSAKLLQLINIRSEQVKRLLTSPQPSAFTWAGITRMVGLPNYFLFLPRKVKRIFIIMLVSAVLLSLPPLIIFFSPFFIIGSLNAAAHAFQIALSDAQVSISELDPSLASLCVGILSDTDDVIRRQPAIICLNAVAVFWLLVMIFVMPFVVALCLLFGALLRHFGRRMLVIGLPEMENMDGRPPVFFLRSFEDDQVRLEHVRGSLAVRLLTIGRPRDSFDTLLLKEGSATGPVVAMGDPRDGGRGPFGAPRSYSDGNGWMAMVEDLIHRSRATVIVLDNTDGTWMEVTKIISRGHAKKTLFVMHPRFTTASLHSLVLEKLLRIAEDSSMNGFDGLRGYRTDSPRRRLLGFHFNSKGSLRVYESAEYSWVSATLLLRVFFESIQGRRHNSR